MITARQARTMKPGDKVRYNWRNLAVLADREVRDSLKAHLKLKGLVSGRTYEVKRIYFEKDSRGRKNCVLIGLNLQQTVVSDPLRHLDYFGAYLFDSAE